jgi:hypothetical protein
MGSTIPIQPGPGGRSLSHQSPHFPPVSGDGWARGEGEGFVAKVDVAAGFGAGARAVAVDQARLVRAAQRLPGAGAGP